MRLLYSLIVVALVSCNTSTGGDATGGSAIDSLRTAVLAIHDEVMPKMSHLTSLQSQLSDKLKELRSEEMVNMDLLKETNQVLGQLNKAESAMWDWMDSYSRYDSIPAEEKEGFLNFEKSSAEDMRDLMLSSIETAEKFLEKNPIKSNVSQEM